MRTTHTTQETMLQQEERLPEGAIPFEEAGINVNAEKDIMSMRWKANEIVKQLWRDLTGRYEKKIHGRKYFVKPTNTKSIITDAGVKQIISTVHMVINPVTSLSYTTEDEAKMFQDEVMTSLNRLFVCDPEFEEVPTHYLNKIETETGLLVYAQLTRGIKGRESKMSVTRINEQYGRQDSNVREQVSTGKSNMFKRDGGDNPYADGVRT